jgi:iron complex outermembrane recepter protein
LRQLRRAAGELRPSFDSDAIGGVVNVIQRQRFKGLDGTVEAGSSERGDGEQYRASLLAGWGDYASRGVNLYVGAEYERNGNIRARDRGFPFNTSDLSSLPGGLNNNPNLAGRISGKVYSIGRSP